MLVLRRLKESGLRPTRQRVALARLLLETGPRHVTAEELFQEARTAGIPVSLATIYNTLHQFTAAGLMTEVVAGSGQSYFDTNPTSHYHYFDKTTGEIIDVPEDAIRFTALPEPPPGKVIDRIDVVVRIRSAAGPAAASLVRRRARPTARARGSQPRSPATSIRHQSLRRSRRASPMTPGSSLATTRPSPAAVRRSSWMPGPRTMTVRRTDSRLECAQPVSPSGSSIRRQTSELLDDPHRQPGALVDPADRVVGAGAGADVDLRGGERGEARQRQAAGSHRALGAASWAASRGRAAASADQEHEPSRSGGRDETVRPRSGSSIGWRGLRSYAAAARV